ncbi:MDR family MFS transporter [Sinomicrobium weinanense]|uniref:MFS transporter n=1 Tax=Sinomicrobium weinanense TaxID=2842200 RepID=A0A926JRL5_9FLAO|nr:MFS transporter [Sinomicrobium weinanense]MBC9796215.1 MFS transporter [Sinomicrobium weinanense]MBU3123494.1 MFS transporter [Sinomicrobium weinanense]
MLRSLLKKYISSFGGFSREIWFLTLITFINRAGTMVLPFLSKYLKEDLHFSYGQIGWIMVCFGIGSMTGSWLGGKFSDKIGFYKVMVFSLFTSGVLFFTLQFITGFWGLCAAMFVIMTISDMFRPAMFVSLGAYSKPGNRTRALTLVRLAINLGFAAGPALGGLIIVQMGYGGLFWIDGATCIIAILLFRALVPEKKKSTEAPVTDTVEKEGKPVFKDKPYWVFLFVTFVLGMLFFQIFTTLPIYHKEVYGLTELQTGLLMSLNGLLIFVFEMPMVSYIEKRKTAKTRLIFLSTILMATSFFILLYPGWIGVLVISMVIITLGEMLGFPYTNAFAMSRASKGREGRYMALYTMSFSLAHIWSAKTGMEIIDRWGYNANWFFMGSLGLIAVACSILLRNMINKEIPQG